MDYIWDLVESEGHDFSQEEMIWSALALTKAAVDALEEEPHRDPFALERAAFCYNVFRVTCCESGAAFLGRWDDDHLDAC